GGSAMHARHDPCTRFASCLAGVAALLTLAAGPAAAAGPLFQSGFTVYDNASFAYSTAIADLDGDGRPDLLTPNQGHKFSIHFSRGDGTFGPRVDAPDPKVYNAYGTTATDFDNDGKADVVWDDYYEIYVARGHGDGTFDPAFILDPATDVQYAFAVGDLNGDGKPDIVAPRGSLAMPTTMSIAVYLGLGDGTFAAPADIAPAGQLSAVLLSDFHRN